MKFRLLCFGLHLIVSLLIAIVSIGLVFWLWYPSPLDKALGVANIFLLLLCIDVIVGPLLTLIVAKQGKKTLKTDFFVIGIIQLIALTYGVYVVAQGRPVWMIYDAGRFELVQAYEVVAAPKDSPSPGGFYAGLTGPVWGAVLEPLPTTVNQGDAYYKAEFLKIYDEKIAHEVGAHAKPFGVLKVFNDPGKVDAIVGAYPEADAYVPMLAKEKSICVLVNKAKGKPIAIVDLSPW